MPRYRIGRDYDSSGVVEEKVIEADSLDEADMLALEWALENVESWAEEIDGDDDGE